MALPALPSTTDIRSITERVNAIIKNIYNKVIPVGADNYVLTSDGTTLAWEALPAYPITNTGATTFLGANVSLNNTANFFNGPNTGSLAAGTYRISAVATARDTAGAAAIVGQIHDGSAAIVGSSDSVAIANASVVMPLERIVTIGSATTFTLQVRDPTSTSGVLLTTGVGTGSPANLATSITWERLS